MNCFPDTEDKKESDKEESSKEEKTDTRTPEQIEAERAAEQEARLEEFFEKNSLVSVGGAAVKSSVSGVYTATSVAGAAVTTPKADVAKNLGLGDGETVSVSTWDVTESGSFAAYVSLATAAKNAGGEMGPAIQVNVNKMVNGQLTSLDGTTGKVAMTVGIPANFFTEGATYAVAHVVSGGATEILNDTDANPHTVSFPVSAGNGAYALVRIR